MKILISSVAAAFLLSACASMDDGVSSGSPRAKSAKEDYVTGSRIPRSESNENYQGAKTMTGQDYREYKSSTGLQSN
jgi:hypothetical protein